MNSKKKYKVNVILTVSGWIDIEAKSSLEALEKAAHLKDVGVNYSDINDPEYHTEINMDENQLTEDENHNWYLTSEW
ncbi:MAG TPA: hypothetical protein VMT35_00730 [Ignavibacteriaceae bacterium]|nr:hypothetical protein [Ignavibacteriaceae bacterium]